MRSKLHNFLNEQKTLSKGGLKKKLKEFLKNNPNPPDKKFHEFAEELGVNEHELEAIAYEMLTSYIQNENGLMEQMNILNEIFIEEAKDDLEILRLSIIAELDAANLYERMAKIAKSPKVKEVLLDVAYEEKVHVGEFETLLEEIDGDYEDAEEEGEEEVEDMTGE